MAAPQKTVQGDEAPMTLDSIVYDDGTSVLFTYNEDALLLSFKYFELDDGVRYLEE